MSESPASASASASAPESAPEPRISAPAATGVGSLPGEDMSEALRRVMGELGDRPGIPFLPELPARGVGADMVGRGALLLADLYAEVQPSGWRIVDRPGRDCGRASSHLSRDLDLLEEHTQGYRGPFKVQAAGPWTLASTIELQHGDKMLSDPGAVRDIAASLAEGLRRHVADLRKRVPGAEFIVQLDEPGLPGVLRGSVRTASGFGTLRAVDEAVVRDTLRTVIDACDVPVAVHCCAPAVPIGLLRQAGVQAVSFDLSLHRERDDDALGEAIEGGTILIAGVLPATEEAQASWAERFPSPDASGVSSSASSAARAASGRPADPLSAKVTVDRLLALRRLGFPAATLARSLVVSPSCGQAGASPAWSVRVLKAAVDAARALEEVD